MAGLVPAIHAVPRRNFETLKRKAFLRAPSTRRGVDARDKRGHDGSGFAGLGFRF